MARSRRPPPKPLRPPSEGDVNAMRQWIGNKHVDTPDSEMIKEINRRIDRAVGQGRIVCFPEVRKLWHKAVLEVHHANRELYQAAMSGVFC